MKGFVDIKNFPMFLLSCLFGDLVTKLFADIHSDMLAILVLGTYIVIIMFLENIGIFES